MTASDALSPGMMKFLDVVAADVDRSLLLLLHMTNRDVEASSLLLLALNMICFGKIRSGFRVLL